DRPRSPRPAPPSRRPRPDRRRAPPRRPIPPAGCRPGREARLRVRRGRLPTVHPVLLQWPSRIYEEDGGGVAALDDMAVDLTVVLGRNSMPVHMLLRMGRGAVIELEATETDMVDILANGYPVARGQVVVNGSRI